MSKFARIYAHERHLQNMRDAAPELYDAADSAFHFLGGVDGAAEIRAQLLQALHKADGGDA